MFEVCLNMYIFINTDFSLNMYIFIMGAYFRDEKLVI